MDSELLKQNQLSRRNFVRSCAAGAAIVAAGPLWGLAPADKASQTGPAHLLFALDQDWLFGGKVNAQTGANNIAAAWEKLTDQLGREKQIALYKASLGL